MLNNDGDFVGFDVVIGNPPYIRQEEIKELKSYLKVNYENYTGASDLYVYFIERSFDLLKNKGNFNFIMPNKWMQAEYGKPVRKFLMKQNIEQIIDFGDLKVFDEATTYPCIFLASKSIPSETIKTVSVTTLNFEKGFDNYIKFNNHVIGSKGFNTETWVISSATEQNLVLKLKNGFKSLSQFVAGKSFRGILTGLSEAFIITEEIRNKLIVEDPKSEQLIHPFLLGRDIKPYSVPKVNKYLILIPKGFTIRKNLEPENPYYISEPMHRYGDMHPTEAWKWFSSSYPAIANHLSAFQNKAEIRTDQGDFWWELRACDYYQIGRAHV